MTARRGRPTRPAWYTAEDARADRAARYGINDTIRTDGGNVGRVAWFDGRCWGCDRTIVAQQTRIQLRNDEWVCVDCAGVRDE